MASAVPLPALQSLNISPSGNSNLMAPIIYEPAYRVLDYPGFRSLVPASQSKTLGFPGSVRLQLVGVKEYVTSTTTWN